MIIDSHVHVCATTPGHGSISQRLIESPTFRFIRRRLGLTRDNGAQLETEVRQKLVATVQACETLDAAVILAFDAVYDETGLRDEANTHLYVTNDYVIELVKQHREFLFGASIHPYRQDALLELERCVERGAVLLKWLPIVQNFNPADERCIPFYEALAHHGLPLLCHTGGEQALPNLNKDYADPALLLPALKRGVTVIAAHCGTKAHPKDVDYLDTFLLMARENERFYGDTSALNLPTRSYAYKAILKDDVVRRKLVHGSDWPIIALPPLRVGIARGAWLLLREKNWMRRDIAIKKALGFDDAYWHRGGTLLRLPKPQEAIP